MQINRLFEIVYLLLSRKTMTAGELAAHFEVSPRTIHRDVETLAQAGIPIYASRGSGGGIHLTPNFVLNKSVLSEREQKSILASLHGMNALHIAEVQPALRPAERGHSCPRCRNFFIQRGERRNHAPHCRAGAAGVSRKRLVPAGLVPHAG